MFKKLFLVLILVLAVAVGGAFGFEKDEECQIKAGSKIFLIRPQQILPVMPNVPLDVTLGDEVPESVATRLNQISAELNSPDLDWNGARVAMVDDGNIVIVLEDYMINCTPAATE